MDGRRVLGIDAGGTHTDAVILEEVGTELRCQAWAKVATNHDDLPSSVTAVLAKLAEQTTARALLPRVTHVTLGTTLAVNALVQGRTEPVGLVLTAGPGLSPKRFSLGDFVTIVPGGLDHRGVEVTRLDTTGLDATLLAWKRAGVTAVACVSKFSPRNPAHELALGEFCTQHGMQVTLGHTLSGQLNFPRRIATAWYNAAVRTIHNTFIDAVTKALAAFDITAQVRFLKADGGAIPLELSRKEPVQSILSGPAASVMGILALTEAISGAQFLLDIGGTTTDIALLVDGSPVLDRMGMLINGRRTLVRALAAQSIGVGGDSLISVTPSGITTGPTRLGNAMAFGGERPTLLDALNTLADTPHAGDQERSQQGIRALAKEHGLDPSALAEAAVDNALTHITTAATTLLNTINAHPIYTLKALRNATNITPDRIFLVGGPANCLKERLSARFSLPVTIPEHADVANAIGAALTRPTDLLEVYADSGKRELRAPKLEYREELSRSCTLSFVKERALTLLREHLAKHDSEDAEVEVLEEDIFAVLSDYGTSSRDIRVTCQAVPGITGKPCHAARAL